MSNNTSNIARMHECVSLCHIHGASRLFISVPPASQVVLGLSIFSYLVYAFTQEASDLIPIVKNFFLKIGPTFANPL